jgi:uncharacterized membrane protein
MSIPLYLGIAVALFACGIIAVIYLLTRYEPGDMEAVQGAFWGILIGSLLWGIVLPILVFIALPGILVHMLALHHRAKDLEKKAAEGK